MHQAALRGFVEWKQGRTRFGYNGVAGLETVALTYKLGYRARGMENRFDLAFRPWSSLDKKMQEQLASELESPVSLASRVEQYIEYLQKRSRHEVTGPLPADLEEAREEMNRSSAVREMYRAFQAKKTQSDRGGVGITDC